MTLLIFLSKDSYQWWELYLDSFATKSKKRYGFWKVFATIKVTVHISSPCGRWWITRRAMVWCTKRATYLAVELCNDFIGVWVSLGRYLKWILVIRVLESSLSYRGCRCNLIRKFLWLTEDLFVFHISIYWLKKKMNFYCIPFICISIYLHEIVP